MSAELFLAAVLAAQTGQPSLPVQEIVVTGERIPRSVRETASSVAVTTEEMIEAQAAPDRIEQILELIPNVQLGSGGEGPTIRGQDTTGAMRDLPAFLGGTRPRTTLIVDGRAVSFNEFIFGIAPIWDVKRVEVFRSPQTTTQGRNSIAGAIFVHSNDPSFEWEGRARGIVGEYDTRQLSVMGSGPIVADQLAFRVAGDIRRSKPSSDIADRVNGADPDKDNYNQLRLKLLATPHALRDARFQLTYVHSESQMPQIEGIRSPFRERRDPLPGYGTFRTKVDSLTAAIGYAPSDKFATDSILSFGNFRARRFAPQGLGQTKLHTRDWAGETVFRWSPGEDLDATGGFSAYRSSLDQFIDLSVLAGLGDFDDRQRSTGIFGELSWTPLPRATLTAGLRYQRDRQQRSGGLGRPGRMIDLDYDRSFDAWLPKISLAYDFSPKIRAGVLVQRAFNPGGTSLRFDTGAPDTFEAETLWDYELFARASLFRDALKLSANLFHYDIRDAQRSQPIVIRAPNGAPVTFADLSNVPRSRSRGLELSANWDAGRRLSLRGAMGLLDTKIIRSNADNLQFEGRQFQRSPRFSASAAIDWRPLDPLRLSAQLRRNSGYFSDDANTPARHIGPATRLDARASWETGRVTMFGYARNVFDNFYLTYLFTPTFATAGDPRELGIGLEIGF